MDIALKPDLERLLLDEARRRDRPASELAEEAIRIYLEAASDEPSGIVRRTRPLIARVWPAEDFSDWQPPR